MEYLQKNWVGYAKTECVFDYYYYYLKNKCKL